MHHSIANEKLTIVPDPTIPSFDVRESLNYRNKCFWEITSWKRTILASFHSIHSYLNFWYAFPFYLLCVCVCVVWLSVLLYLVKETPSVLSCCDLHCLFTATVAPQWQSHDFSFWFFLKILVKPQLSYVSFINLNKCIHDYSFVWMSVSILSKWGASRGVKQKGKQTQCIFHFVSSPFPF